MKRRSFIAGLFAAPLVPVAAKATPLPSEIDDALRSEMAAMASGYEKGTFRIGTYVRVGNMVTVTCPMRQPSGEPYRITGLPLIAKGD